MRLHACLHGQRSASFADIALRLQRLPKQPFYTEYSYNEPLLHASGMILLGYPCLARAWKT